MYVPQHFEETRSEVLHDLMRAQPLGSLVTVVDGAPSANHVPFVLDASRGEHGTLMCHVAKVNPVWQTLASAPQALVVFHGAQSYVSPSWYPSKHEHGKTVPTWNYAVVHAHGNARAIQDADWLLRHLNDLTSQQEATQAVPWKVSDAPADYLEKLLQAIVGIEIPIARLTGKWKVSQNRPHADKLGVVAGLHARGDAVSLEMAELVARGIQPK